jgi:hypothetical protein
MRRCGSGRAWRCLCPYWMAGVVAGTWCAFFCEYDLGERYHVYSFPVPVAFSHLENDDWVGYVVPLFWFVMVMNMCIVVLGCGAAGCVAKITREKWRKGSEQKNSPLAGPDAQGDIHSLP